MKRHTILVVDDDSDIRELIDVYLRTEDYNTLMASNGIEALELLKEQEPDLIILDIMMPGMDGIETCIKLRNDMDIPIIFLSAKAQDTDKILGLTIGADDYITKPFNPLELIARVKSQLRRYTKLNNGNRDSGGIIEIEELYINVLTHEVREGDREIKLTPTEFSILELLARNKGIVFAIDRIYEEVWKEEYFESDNTVMVHIRKIREKIERNPREPRYLKTVWGVGYKIEN
ncbi:MAG TPA: response regulator transcription factor [Clostridia bacterium]|nr:response regulator transcription factor [Clostridia bacterium]